MKTPNRERQRKWKKKQLSNGLRAVTIMLPTRIKDLIDKECKKTGDTIAKVIERAAINLLGSPGTAPNDVLRDLPPEDVQQMAADLRSTVHRFEETGGMKPSVTSNEMTVTSDGSQKPEQQNGYPKEIYRLVRLLHDMEVSHDEIAFTLNKRKYKTLSGDNEWKLGDVETVLNDIHQKYGHIDPLFPILDNP